MGSPTLRNLFSPSALLSFAVAFAVFALIGGQIKFWDAQGASLIPAFRYSLLLALLLAFSAYVKNGRRFSCLKITAQHFASILVVVFFSDFLCRNYSFLRGPSIRGTIIIGALLGALLLLRLGRSWINIFTVLAALILIAEFLTCSQGRLLFSDDHPSVLYRLYLLRENFPFIPFYNPEWNAGMDARDFFATGTLNIFLPFAPLIYLFDLVSVYNLIVALVLFVVLPASLYLACRIEELPDPVPALAALLGLSSSLVWYRWGFKYGAMGFVMSAALLPLNLALARKILAPGKEISLREAGAFVISLTLMVFWPLAGVMLLPAIFYAACTLTSTLKKKYVKGILISLLVLNVPWMIMFLSVSQVGTFLSLKRPVIENREQGLAESEERESTALTERVVRYQRGQLSLRGVLHAGRDFFEKANPLLLLAIPGFLLLKGFRRYAYTVQALWLLFLGLVVALFKPQLELERMLVALSILLAVPAALALNETIKKQGILACLCIGFLIAGLFSSAFIVRNRSIEQYRFADPIVHEMSEALKKYGGNGRVVFSGFMLHQLSSGHIAPLALFSGTELVASSPFHNLWWYTDLIPASYSRRKREGIEQFLDLKNATAVMAYEPKWKEYFDSYSERYRRVWNSGQFSLYKRNTPASFFLHGEGEILERTSSKILFKLSSSEAVLKFTYFPFLKVEGCVLTPEAAAEGITLVKVSSCPLGIELELVAINPLQRLING